MAGPKADKLTKERRVEVVYRLILNGYNTAQILQDTADWPIKQRQRESYIAEAWGRIVAVSDADLSEHKRRAVAAHYQMLREAKTVKEKAIVWAALARLLGLDAPKAVAVSGKDGGPIQHEHRGQTHGEPEHLAIVLATLVRAGAVQLSGDGDGDAAEDDGLHPA